MAEEIKEKKASAAAEATEKKAPAKKPAAKKPAAKKAEGEKPAKKPAAKKPAEKKAPAAKKAAAPKKAPAKKTAAAGTLNIRLAKSLNGRGKEQMAVAVSLGLKRPGDTTVQPDNAATTGKIKKISHLVVVTKA